MARHLQAILDSRGSAGPRINGCWPGDVVFLGNEAVVRYDVEVGGPEAGTLRRMLLSGRVLAGAAAAAGYARDRLAPLSARLDVTQPTATLGSASGVVADLGIAVYPFPVDPELPTLVEAVDPVAMTTLFGALLPDATGQMLAVNGCMVDRWHYARARRCTLRYSVDVSTADGRRRPPMLVFGKVTADGHGALTGAVTSSLRPLVLSGAAAFPFVVPRSFGFVAPLRLTLLEWIPGVPRVAKLLKATLEGAGAVSGDDMHLADALRSSASVAACIHGSEIDLGPTRTFEGEIRRLDTALHLVHQVTPALGAILARWLDRTRAMGVGSLPLELHFAHGDFSSSQVLFDGRRCGLVDFDSVCQAEPALDLGHFLAYLRLAGRKASDTPGGDQLVDEMCSLFLDSYCSASSLGIAELSRLLARTALYELVSLLRLAIHSWQKLKGQRLANALSLISERGELLGERV